MGLSSLFSSSIEALLKDTTQFCTISHEAQTSVSDMSSKMSNLSNTL